MIPRQTDGALVQAAQVGDEHAYNHIVKRHTEHLWPLACSYSQDFDDAQDLLQETFIRAYERLHLLREPEKIRPWLSVMMRRLAITRQEKRRVQQSRNQEQITSNSLQAPQTTPETLYASKELGEHITHALTTLTKTSRQIFVAFYVEEKSLVEISKELNLSTNAVKNRLFHSRKNLQKELKMTAQEHVQITHIPKKLNIIICGEGNHADARLHPQRLAQRYLTRCVLFACRKAPKSISELSKILNADALYIEDTIPDLVEGDLLHDTGNGTYLTNFLFLNAEELGAVRESISILEKGLPILKQSLPKLKSALKNTNLVKEQGFDWPYLSWITMPCWILERGLGRQVDHLPTWGHHRPMVYPIRPVDFWHLLGLGDSSLGYYSGTRSSESDRNGFGISLAIEKFTTVPHMIKTNHQARYIGKLIGGPETLEALIEDAPNPQREKEQLARYVEQRLIVKDSTNQYRLNIPVVTAADDDMLTPVIDEISENLSTTFLDTALTQFSECLESLHFTHLHTQPNYIGYIGLLIATNTLARQCVDTHLLIPPPNPPPVFGAWAWWNAPKLMRGWSREQ